MTVTEKVLVAMFTPSLTVRVTEAMPDWLRAGVRVTLRLAPLPPSRIPDSGSNEVLVEAAVTASEAAAVSASPTVKAIGDDEPLVLRDTAGIALMVGAAFADDGAVAEAVAE